MATMNVSLPDRMKEWVEEQARGGRYANASDYVRDLIRRDQEKRETDWLIAEVAPAYDAVLADPDSAVPADEVRADLRARHARRVREDT